MSKQISNPFGLQPGIGSVISRFGTISWRFVMTFLKCHVGIGCISGKFPVINCGLSDSGDTAPTEFKEAHEVGKTLAYEQNNS